MDHFYHLLIRRASDRAALIEWHGNKWLLPVLAVRQERQDICDIAAAAHALGFDGFLTNAPLGHVSSDLSQVDWLAHWIGPDIRPDTHVGRRAWAPPEQLASHPSTFPVQRLLLAANLAQGVTAGAIPFDEAGGWLVSVWRWICDALGRSPGHEPDLERRFTQHRVSRSRVVLAVKIDSHREVYFRATIRRPLHEARLARWLGTRTGAITAPGILTVDEDRGWWLSAHASGQPLARDTSQKELADVIRRIARAQIAMMATGHELEQLGIVRINWNTVNEEAQSILATLTAGSQGRGGDYVGDDAIDDTRRLVESICARAAAIETPLTWVDTDLSYGNIFVSPSHQVEVIDLEESLLSIPHLALEALLLRTSRVEPRTRDWHGELKEAYRREWRHHTSPIDLRACEELAPRLLSLLSVVDKSRETRAKIQRKELIADLRSLHRRAARWLVKALSASLLTPAAP